MKMRLFFYLMLLPLSIFAQPALQWEMKTITEGLVWKKLHTQQLFDSWQHINVLEIAPSLKLNIAYRTDTLVRTSNLAKANNALAAVNGGFFDMRHGGSVTYLEINDSTINESIDKLFEQQNEILEGVLAISPKGKLMIEGTTSNFLYKPKKKHRSVLITGPLLLLKGKRLPFVDRKFTNDRHPRTCACTTNNNKTLLITVDGRNEKASGMSLPELATLMQQLDCKNAINLDGGGSTTMYVRGEGKTGVVNHPSDNKRFDTGGERPCANAVLVMSNK